MVRAEEAEAARRRFEADGEEVIVHGLDPDDDDDQDDDEEGVTE